MPDHEYRRPSLAAMLLGDRLPTQPDLPFEPVTIVAATYLRIGTQVRSGTWFAKPTAQGCVCTAAPRIQDAM
jgi:hypothetical protein